MSLLVSGRRFFGDMRLRSIHFRPLEEAMKACAKFVAACIVVVLGLTPHGVSAAAELTILTHQGATPGVKELAAAFARASGHKVTVTQVEGDALNERIKSGRADLVTGNPE